MSRALLALPDSQWEARRGPQGLYKAPRSAAAAGGRGSWRSPGVRERRVRVGVSVPRVASLFRPGEPGWAEPSRPGRGQVCAGAEGGREEGVVPEAGGWGGAAMSGPRGA